MALLGLDRIVKKDLFTAELWNNMVDILEAKFSSGVAESDLAWPMLVQGDIDFGQTYNIVGLRSFWNIVNAAEYSTLDAAVSAAEATGGGAVFIPPYTTIEAANVSIDASNITIFGAGASSVIKITAASTGPLFTTGIAGLSGIRFMNLTLDGTGGGAGCVGVRARKVDKFQMLNVYMTAFTGNFIHITNDGTAGQASTDAYLENVHCSLGSASHLACDDVSGLTVVGFSSKSASGDAISMVPTGASNLIQDVILSNVRVQSGGAKGIRIIGSGATGIDAHSRISLSNCHVVGCSGLPFELGNTATLLKDTMVKDCFAPDSLTDGLRIATNRGLVTGCHFPAAIDDGIEITNSVDLVVQGNGCQDAGAYGVNADTTTDCTVLGNNCRDAITDGINRATSTNLIARGNAGDIGPTIGSVFADQTGYALGGTTTGDMGFTHTIPANSLKVGDVVEIVASVVNAAGAVGTIQTRLGATNIYTISTLSTCDHYVRILLRANPGGNSGVFGNTLREDRTPGSTFTDMTENSPTIDWTIDQILTFNMTVHGGSGTITIGRIYVNLLGTK